MGMGAASGASALPPGWVEAKDPRYNNTTYWYHSVTKETSWTRPTGPPPSLAAQQGGYGRHPGYGHQGGCAGGGYGGCCGGYGSGSCPGGSMGRGMGMGGGGYGYGGAHGRGYGY